MADELVPAIWRGPYPALLPNNAVVNVGDEALVTPGDLLSDHWEAVKPAKQAKPAKSDPGSDS